MEKIPLVDLKRQYSAIKSEIDSAIKDVIDNTAFIMGQHVKSFEANFAKECQVPFGIGASSGTTAIYLALKALGIKEGDEVITVPNTFIATTEAISQAGARVVFVDIDPKTYNMDASKIEKVITSQTKAILPVHLYGQPADMDAIQTIAKKYSLKIIEDACQAHMAEYKGKRAGSLGDVGCFSFYPGKNLGAYGDGGIVVTKDSDLADLMRKLSDHGRINKYEYVMEGYNGRLDALQAAILNVKLKYLDAWTEKRRALANLYNTALKDVSEVVLPYEVDDVRHVYHLYVIRVKNRDRVLKFLADRGIFAGIHYPFPLHLQKAYTYLGYQQGDFSVSEKYALEILSLPMFPELSQDDVERVVKELKESVVA